MVTDFRFGVIFFGVLFAKSVVFAYDRVENFSTFVNSVSSLERQEQKLNFFSFCALIALFVFFIQDGIKLFQGDIVMTSEILNNLRSRGILVPNNDPSLPLCPDGGKKPLKRPKRAIMRTNRGSDLRWLIGRSGKREVPFQITRSNCKFSVRTNGL